MYVGPTAVNLRALKPVSSINTREGVSPAVVLDGEAGRPPKRITGSLGAPEWPSTITMADI